MVGLLFVSTVPNAEMKAVPVLEEEIQVGEAAEGQGFADEEQIDEGEEPKAGKE